jgi:hypothetical protein
MPSTEDGEIFFEQNHMGAFLGDIDRRIDGNADIRFF